MGSYVHTLQFLFYTFYFIPTSWHLSSSFQLLFNHRMIVHFFLTLNNNSLLSAFICLSGWKKVVTLICLECDVCVAEIHMCVFCMVLLFQLHWKIPRAKMLCYVIRFFSLLFVRDFVIFIKLIVPFCIPSSHKWELLLLHILLMFFAKLRCHFIPSSQSSYLDYKMD